MSGSTPTRVHDQKPVAVRDLDPLTKIQGAFIWLLKNVFGELEYGKLRWDKDERTTEIVIGADRLRTSGLGQRPGLVIRPGTTQTANLSMDQKVTVDSQTGNREHLDLDSTTIICMCVSKNPVEARRIAWITRSAVRQYRRTLQREGGMHQISEPIRVEGLSDPSGYLLGSKDQEWVGIPVYVPVFFADQWSSIVIDTPQLKEIEQKLNISTFEERVLATPRDARPPSSQGKPVKTIVSFNL